MTLKDIAKQLTTAVQTVPNLVQILRDGLEQAEAGDEVVVTQTLASGTEIGSIKVGDEDAVKLYAPEVIYSTTERKIGKWINDSDLYEKTIFIEHLPNGTISDDWVFYNTEIQGNLNVIEMKGIAIFANNYRSPIPYALANSVQGALLSQIGLNFKTETNQIGIMCGTDRSAVSAYVTIRYTKVNS